MRRVIRIAAIVLIVVPVVALAVGCGASRQALRSEVPRVDFRLPPAEAVDIGLIRERAARPAPAPPFSAADESRGRWLTLFEMNVGPSEAAGLPPAPAESP